MRVVLFILLAIAMLAVLVTLGFGFFTLLRGGEFGRKWSNKLMQLRIALSVTVIALLTAIVVTRH
jgi:hypothetical protein